VHYVSYPENDKCDDLNFCKDFHYLILQYIDRIHEFVRLYFGCVLMISIVKTV
jgi:hypothetical protein